VRRKVTLLCAGVSLTLECSKSPCGESIAQAKATQRLLALLLSSLSTLSCFLHLLLYLLGFSQRKDTSIPTHEYRACKTARMARPPRLHLLGCINAPPSQARQYLASSQCSSKDAAHRNGEQQAAKYELTVLVETGLVVLVVPALDGG